MSGRNGVYELLFSFSSPGNKAKFLRWLQSNDETCCEEDMIMLPRQEENEAAQPVARVLPANVMRQVTVIATMLYRDSSDTVQESRISPPKGCTRPPPFS
jgi:hypothetical protein